MYHDILATGAEPDSSGFKGGGPAVYKISADAFREHLNVIRQSCARAGLVTESFDRENALFITFDDGGTGFLTAADILEEFGYRGHFFITSDYIGTDGFLDELQIRNLRSRGHVVGSHSRSHPERMATLSRDCIENEWRESVQRLREILDSDILTASVPGGYYSRHVARAAGNAGIKYLFNSEPVRSIATCQGCKILGRYTITGNTETYQVGALADNCLVPALSQYLKWNAKKIVKKLCGEQYVRLRKKMIG